MGFPLLNHPAIGDAKHLWNPLPYQLPCDFTGPWAARHRPRSRAPEQRCRVPSEVPLGARQGWGEWAAGGMGVIKPH